MTDLVNSIRSYAPTSEPGAQGFTRRTMVVAALVATVSLVPQGWGIALEAMSEAYLAVAVFVAGTLALVSYAERGFRIDLGTWLDRRRQWQVPVATLLGAFPGCGGAIIAVTQYTRGYLSFGAVVATLIATMGDAMFLLLVREPQTAFGVLGVSMAIGTLTGYIVDHVHGGHFLRPSSKDAAVGQVPAGEARAQKDVGKTDAVWLSLMLPGAVFGIAAAFQIEADAFLASITGFEFAHWLGVAGAALALAMWASAGEARVACKPGDMACQQTPASALLKVVDTTNFVTSWVVFAFVGYELLVALSGVDLATVFAVWAPLVPAMAVLIGLVPGCGPQLLVTSLYLSGTVPLSAQLGNAIANDGDALFPALAVAPKAAVVATLYSAIPAIVVAYGWYGWVESGAV
jgi:hypothetical protein